MSCPLIALISLHNISIINISSEVYKMFNLIKGLNIATELWSNTKWSEITSNYSGLFFRAEGGGSESFGKIQQANQTWIS